jgi:uncharacterized membrane protein YphA (DoxX/SURF4 family)
MSFSQFAGTAIVPTLSRIVLAVAFISVGHNKLFTHAEFDAAQATTLRNLGVNVQPVEAESAAAFGEPRLVPALFQSGEDEPARGASAAAEDQPPPTEADQSEVEESEQAQQPPHIDAEDIDETTGAEEPAAVDTPETDAAEPLAEGTYRARSLYHVALMVDGAGLPQPVYGAWIAALTEFIGGILLLFGFLSRIWGLGLAFAMGVAFYVTTVQGAGVFETWPWKFSQNIGDFNRMYAQLGLGLLALGILLTGPGPISLDRLFFGGNKREKEPLSDVGTMSTAGPLSASGVPPARPSNAERPQPSEPPSPRPPQRDDDNNPPPGRRPL